MPPRRLRFRAGRHLDGKRSERRVFPRDRIRGTPVAVRPTAPMGSGHPGIHPGGAGAGRSVRQTAGARRQHEDGDAAARGVRHDAPLRRPVHRLARGPDSGRPRHVLVVPSAGGRPGPRRGAQHADPRRPCARLAVRHRPDRRDRRGALPWRAHGPLHLAPGFGALLHSFLLPGAAAHVVSGGAAGLAAGVPDAFDRRRRAARLDASARRRASPGPAVPRPGHAIRRWDRPVRP